MGIILLSHQWELGDGRYSAEHFPYHTYKMPARYKVSLSVTDLYGNVVTASTYVYVYDWDYLGGLNVSKTNTCVRFAIPQAPSQGKGWSEYDGVINGQDELGWPYPPGIAGTCQVIDNSENKRQLVMDCNTWRRYELGIRNQWLDGEDDYGGTEIESDIMLKEHVPPTGASAKLKHGQSHGRLKPWNKEVRNTERYDEHGFPRTLERDVYYRTDSGIIDNAVVKDVPRKAQIVSDRHIESEYIQVGYRFRGAPWRLTQVQQWYREIDTSAAPPEKLMNEFSWGTEWVDKVLWMPRAHTINTDYATGVAFGGSIASQVTGPDDYSRSAVNFGATGGLWVASVPLQTGNFSVSIWVRKPITADRVLWQFATGTLVITFEADEEVRFNDGTNDVRFDAETDTDWIMVTIVRSNGNLIGYINGVLSNTYSMADANIDYGGRVDIGSVNLVAYDAQILPKALSADAVEYAYNDVIQNRGNSVGWLM